jgi:cell wall-associated NlpC family hydrolase
MSPESEDAWLATVGSGAAREADSLAFGDPAEAAPVLFRDQSQGSPEPFPETKNEPVSTRRTDLEDPSAATSGWTNASERDGETRRALIEIAKDEFGAPYSYGGASGRWGLWPLDQWDCSGFVAWVMRDKTGNRVELDPFTDHMYDQLSQYETEGPQVGDVVLYEYEDKSQPGVRFPHTAIYMGKDLEGRDMVMDARDGPMRFNKTHGDVGIHPMEIEAVQGERPRFFRVPEDVSVARRNRSLRNP